MLMLFLHKIKCFWTGIWVSVSSSKDFGVIIPDKAVYWGISIEILGECGDQLMEGDTESC